MYQPNKGSGRHQSPLVAASASRGISVTSGGSPNTKGSWTNSGVDTLFDAEALSLQVFNGANSVDILVDLGIDDGSGNVFPLLSDWHPIAQNGAAAGSGIAIELPIHVPKGSRLAARTACSNASTGCGVNVTIHEGGLNGCPGFSRAIPLFTAASSRGVAIDPGGTANTKGSWVDMTASCPEDIGGMFGCIGSNGDVARSLTAARALLDIGIGAAGSEQVIYGNAGFAWTTTFDSPYMGIRIPPFACSILAGTRIAARAQCSYNTAGDRTFDLGLYGLVR